VNQLGTAIIDAISLLDKNSARNLEVIIEESLFKWVGLWLSYVVLYSIQFELKISELELKF
jgi:hypothetical protein